MEYCQHKSLCYNCDEKYVKSHIYREEKVFHMDVSLLVTIDEVIPKEPPK